VTNVNSKFKSSELDGMLQSGHLGRGCFGLLERLPLFIKLCLMLVIALLGLLGFGVGLIATNSATIKTQRSNKDLAHKSVIISKLITELTKERGTARYVV
jgi:hypothetical protein